MEEIGGQIMNGEQAAGSEQTNMLYGSTGGERGRVIIVKTDGDGRLEVLSHLMAVNPSGDPVHLLTDAQGLLRVRGYEPYETIIVTDIGIAWTVCAENAIAGSIMRVWVEIWKYAIDNFTSGLDIRFDDGGATHEIVHDFRVMTQVPAAKFGPYHLGNGWSIDMRTNIAARCRCVATIEHYGMDAL